MSVLIGRDPELARLLELAKTPPALALMVGEAGIGKTTLLEELARHGGLGNHRLLVGHCFPMRNPFPLGPVIEALGGMSREPPAVALSAVVGALRPLLPELAASLPRRPKPSNDQEAELHRVFRGLRELLGALGPTVCVLEDLHWADERTLQFLQFLVFAQPDTLTLVLTHRGSDPARSSSLEAVFATSPRTTSKATIDLSGLSVDAVRRLLVALLQTDGVSEEFACCVREWTGGIPFAVKEVAALIEERGEIEIVGQASPPQVLERLGVPRALRHSAIEKMRSLGDAARLTAGAAAVLRHGASDELISKVAGLRPSCGSKALCEALSSALLEEHHKHVYGFRHPLAAQAVYVQIPGPERRQLHLRAAKALESMTEPCPHGEIAYHYKEAGRTHQWLRYSEAAADAASAVGDDRAAVHILEEVLAAPDLPRTTRTRMALKLGDSALFGRVPQPGIAAIERAIDDPSLPAGVRGELRFCLARLVYLAGDGDFAYRQMTRAVDELKRRPALAARAMATLAAALPVEGQVSEHLLWINRAVLAAARQDDPLVTTEVLGSRAEILLEIGHPTAWQAVEDIPWNASSPKQRLELVRTSKYLARAALLLGHYPYAESLLNCAERIRRDLGHERFGVGLATVKAQLDWSTGRWERLEERARRLVESSAEGPVIAQSNQLILAWLLLTRGHVEDAAEGFRSVLEAFRDTRERWLFASAATGLARIHLARGDEHEALEVATLALGASPKSGTWTWTYSLAPVAIEALVECGAVGEARELTGRLADGLDGVRAPAATAALALCRGLLAQADGHGDVAARRLAHAEALWSALPSPYEAAQVLERRARCLLASGDPTGGDCLLSAFRAFDHLGASWDAARVRAALRIHKLSLPHPWRGGQRGYGQQLSPREHEVASLAATGMTNRQIAESLFISSRTVENHVAAALRKQSVASRKDLPQAPEGHELEHAYGLPKARMSSPTDS